MGDKSKIQWTDATWNPVTGCNKVSRGCANCYAERDWKRLSENPETVYHGRAFNDVRCHEERLDLPLRWRKPRKIFVNSMSDLFHESIPFTFIEKVYDVMRSATHHTFQVLTKRPQRMLQFFREQEQRLPWVSEENIWIGVSCEDQKTADERIPILLKTPACVRWVSLEPLLGPIDLTKINTEWGSTDALRGISGVIVHPSLNWVVVGGESGPRARPLHPDWVRSLRDQCTSASVAFEFKQWGEWKHGFDLEYLAETGAVRAKSQIKLNGLPMIRVGKKAAGRILDGREWNEYPSTKTGVTS